MGDPISLLIYIVIAALLIWLLFWVLSQMAMPQPVRTIILVVVALIMLVWILRVVGFPVL